jgi:hypothetical protein
MPVGIAKGHVPSPSLKAEIMNPGRSLSRLFVLTGMIFTAVPAAQISAPGRDSRTDATTPLVRNDALRPPEVRLRKLHLVRPDLIPYPIEYEVVC